LKAISRLGFFTTSGTFRKGACSTRQLFKKKKETRKQSSQVNTPPKAKSQAKDKRAKDRQKYAALCCKVGVAAPGFEVRRRMSRVDFRVFPLERKKETRKQSLIEVHIEHFRVHCNCLDR